MKEKLKTITVTRTSTITVDPARLEPAREFMRREFRRVPSLPEVAQAVGMSPWHFHRQYKIAFSETPKDYMLGLQVEEAKRLIAAGAALDEVARDCGFATQSHFTIRFKQATGITPGAWRKQQGAAS